MCEIFRYILVLVFPDSDQYIWYAAIYSFPVLRNLCPNIYTCTDWEFKLIYIYKRCSMIKPLQLVLFLTAILA